MGASVPALVLVKLFHGGRPQPFLVPDPMATEPLLPGDALVVDTGNGTALGHVLSINGGERHAPQPDPALKVVRRASREDLAIRARQEQREREAYRISLMKIRERGLPMKLARVEQLFDGSRLIFYFTAEGRVDFRELVRELAAEFRTRIELRQIGVRDEAKLLGGYGSCGRPLCCSAWLLTFEPVSIKMAKKQELSLNPSKLSGLCGRLKCCLRFELPEAGGACPAPCCGNGIPPDSGE